LGNVCQNYVLQIALWGGPFGLKKLIHDKRTWASRTGLAKSGEKRGLGGLRGGEKKRDRRRDGNRFDNKTGNGGS